MVYIEQDVLKKLDVIIGEYDYYTSQVNNTSCSTTGYVVIMKDTSILGCVGISKNTIKHLRVVTKYKRQGIGSLLLKKSESILKRRGYVVGIAYVHANNLTAQNFFYKNNYLPVSCDDYYYILQKDLE